MLIFGKLVLRNHFPRSDLMKSIRDDSSLNILFSLTFIHAKTQTMVNEPDPLNLRNGSDTAQKVIRLFHYQILALDLGGGYQNENSQIDFSTESETKVSVSMD